MSKFTEDLKFGNKGEKIYMAYLAMQGAKDFSTNDTDSHDIKCNYNGKELLFEVKYDRYESNNIVIEFFDGRRLKNTGVLVTKADYYVTIFQQYNEMWSIETGKLLDLLFKQGQKFPVIWGGDESKTMMFKIPKDWIKTHFNVKEIKFKKLE